LFLIEPLVALITPSQTGQWIRINKLPFKRFMPISGRKSKIPIFGIAVLKAETEKMKEQKDITGLKQNGYLPD
jgi:hypothetical protein